MSPKCKVSFFFFLFKLFTKSSWKSERQLPLQGLKSIKTTTEQLKQSEREKEKETTSNVWHLVLSTGFPSAPLGIESKYIGKHSFSVPGRAALCSQTVGVGTGKGLAPHHLLGPTRLSFGCPTRSSSLQLCPGSWQGPPSSPQRAQR